MAEGHAVARWARELQPPVGRELVRVEVPSTEEAAADGLGSGEGERCWVYRRRGKPCRRCDEEIRMVRQGEHARTTYFCPACQT